MVAQHFAYAGDRRQPRQITYQQKNVMFPLIGSQPTPNDDDNRDAGASRKSRIYFMRQFFDYPITLSADTLRKLGLFKTIRIGLSYLRALLFPIRNEQNLEQFFINRFGRELYLTFFKSYTEKVGESIVMRSAPNGERSASRASP